MKKLLISVAVIFLLLFSINVQAGQPLGLLRHWIVPPNSVAFGDSLDGWMEAYVRWLEDGADTAVRIGNVAFLPISPGPTFNVEVEVGTALVLPVATYLGFPEDDPLPDEWFGNRAHIFGDVTLNEGGVFEINEDYYVGPTYLDPTAFITYPFGTFEIAFYQALACVILPLPVGEHEIVLHSEFVDFGVVFDNTWNIVVVP
jgi:hypothetical protein